MKRAIGSRILACCAMIAAASVAASNPVMFVTVTPSSGDTTSSSFAHFVSLIGNHRAVNTLSPRGGDLYIRYDDGTLRNLTAECGYGLTEGAEITVREPNIHWSGQKAIFSMVVGGTGFSTPPPVYYQIYEITGILQGQTAAITKIPGQPANYNNVQPCYGSDDSIIFGSDQPASKNPAHYPHLDEYESTPVVSGLWKINADGSGLRLLDNCPSGDFTPFVDSFGRVIFTRWDHLKRDQQADLWIDEQLYYQKQIANGVPNPTIPSRAMPFTYADENSASFQQLAYGHEYFPENGRLHPDVAGTQNPTQTPHAYWDQDYVPGMKKQDFNFFLPWMVNQDGTDAEVLNHLGRHEFFGYVEPALVGLPDHFRSGVSLRSFSQIREDPNTPGRYYMIDGAEFGAHGAGRLIRLDAPAGANADDIPASFKNVSPYQNADYAGGAKNDMFRDPMIRTDGTVWVSCTGTPDEAHKVATDPGAPNPYPLSSNYNFRIRKMIDNGKGFLEPGEYLIPGGINKSVTYKTHYFWPTRSVAYNGPMWEVFPVEVVARPVPPLTGEPAIATPEHNVLMAKLGSEAKIEELRDWMRDQNLALIIARDVTMRADKQQPFNLKVADSAHQHAEVGSTPTEIDYMQILAARYVRGYGNGNQATVPASDLGRRQIARIIDNALNPPLSPTSPSGAVQIAADGSVAAFVPAQRALTWQLTKPDGTPVVRERYWITFQPGEIRFCFSCHGPNKKDVFNNPLPSNESQALETLLDWWNTQFGQASVPDWTSFQSLSE